MNKPKFSEEKPFAEGPSQTLPLGMEFREPLSVSDPLSITDGPDADGFSAGPDGNGPMEHGFSAGPDGDVVRGGSHSEISAQSVDGVKNGPDKEW